MITSAKLLHHHNFYPTSGWIYFDLSLCPFERVESIAKSYAAPKLNPACRVLVADFFAHDFSLAWNLGAICSLKLSQGTKI